MFDTPPQTQSGTGTLCYQIIVIFILIPRTCFLLPLQDSPLMSIIKEVGLPKRPSQGRNDEGRDLSERVPPPRSSSPVIGSPPVRAVPIGTPPKQPLGHSLNHQVQTLNKTMSQEHAQVYMYELNKIFSDRNCLIHVIIQMRLSSARQTNLCVTFIFLVLDRFLISQDSKQFFTIMWYVFTTVCSIRSITVFFFCVLKIHHPTAVHVRAPIQHRYPPPFPERLSPNTLLNFAVSFFTHLFLMGFDVPLLFSHIIQL